jgi:hypothetical protein
MNRVMPQLLSGLSVVWMIAAPHAAGAQVRDEGILALRFAGAEAGLERFSSVPTPNGFKLTSELTLTTARPALQFAMSVDRSSPGDFAFQFRRSAGPSAQYFAILSKNRLTVRRIEVGTEYATESRGTQDMVPLADSMVAPLLQLVPPPGETERSYTAVYPDGNRRVRVLAMRSTEADGSARIAFSGGLEGVLILAPDGTIRRVSLPGLRLEAERQLP